MSKAEVTQRLMCSEAKVESQRVRSGRLAQDDWPRLTAACDKLMKAPIYVDDTGSITMMELRSKARRLKSREPKLGLIIVDYLQLMTSGGTVENRVQEVSQISRTLKVLARDLDVPILAVDDGSLTFHGITLYGAVDIGVAYQRHGTPLSNSAGLGLEYLISKNSNQSRFSLAPNAVTSSNVGLKGTVEMGPEVSAVFKLETAFLPTSGASPTDQGRSFKTMASRSPRKPQTPIPAETARHSTARPGPVSARRHSGR